MVTKDVYKLFCKYGSQLLWVEDSTRNRRPNGTNEETDKMFVILERVDHNLELLSIDGYSLQLKKEFKTEIEKFKPMIAPEVFKLMSDKYKK
ncbi:hypothetical protein [Dokdonia sp.]|uniref:hypothetical protein n=1 Tax=Dokdonia sp. TaxID=2024995 RepID=UPI003265F28F